MGKPAALLSAIVIAVVGTHVLAQAPDDKDAHSCVQPTVPNGLFRLLDSAWYRLLLSGSTSANAGWTQTPANSWTESGLFCSRTLQSSGTSDSWLVTQHVYKSTDVSYPLGITVQVRGEVQYDCFTDPTCRNDIQLYYYPSSGPIAGGQAVNTFTDQYLLIGTLSFGYTSAVKSLTFSLGAEYDRFYIAIRQQESGFKLRNLQVSYQVCPAGTEGRVVYPQTAIGASAVQAVASCSEGSTISEESSPNVTCNTDGTYSGSPVCLCEGGYFDFNEQCYACAAGSYSSVGATSCTPCPENSNSVQGSDSCKCNSGYYKENELCKACPLNSHSTESGTTICDCDAGYYRTSDESASYACTTAPSEPQALTLISCNDTTATVSWMAPSSTGGRSDVSYILGYKVSEEDFSYIFSSSPIMDTVANITGLQPLTTYTVVVRAENGITQEYAHFSSESRTSFSLTFTTKEGVPSAPAVNVLGRGSVLVWTVPEMPNGVIKYYDIRMIGDQATKYAVVDSVTFYYEPRLQDLPHGSNITVQVRGVTDAGAGAWSAPLIFSENAIHCLDTSDHAPTTDNCTDNNDRMETQELDICSCSVGYQSTCANINECLTNNGGCGDSICIDTEGSYYCDCSLGYELDNETNCLDVNECTTNNGGCGDICTNTPGSYVCSCSVGYQLAANSKDCVDVNECDSENGGCSHTCTNVEGSFACGCPSDYQLQGNTKDCIPLPTFSPTSLPTTPPSCGGNLTTSAGTISIPATVIGLSVDCMWLIIVPDSKNVVKLTMDTQSGMPERSSSECPNEYVAIYNGEGTGSVLLGRYCLNSLPPSINSSTNALTIVFHAHTQMPILKADLSISYASADPPAVMSRCGQYLDPGVIFSSPGFPEPYDSVYDCYYRIYGGSVRYQFKLIYTDLDCTTEDTIEVYDGLSTYFPLLQAIACPTSVSQEMLSTHSFLTVVFKQRTPNTFKGFQGVFVPV